MKQVGARELVEAADTLNRPASDSQFPIDLKPADWPEAIRRLDPKRVAIRADGVRIPVYEFWVEPEGISIVFEDSPPPKDYANLKRVAERIYWWGVY